MDKLGLLKTFFGHTAFRPGQEEIVDALLSRRDVLGVMPTGAGKSVCYQLPALMLPGLTLVVSPLIALMKDQVTALAQAGVPAAYLNSSLSFAEHNEVIRSARAGAYKLLYVAPERLMAGDFLQLASDVEISLVAVDEAHCVSQWGQDFRPSYLQIPQFIGKLARRPAVGAFTATATAQVKEDVRSLLRLEDPFQLTTGFDRPNLYFEVARPKSKDAWLADFLARRPDQSGIVYCATRKGVEAVCQRLEKAGISATRYHAGLEDRERRRNQEDFVFDRARVMVATNAFGMGIDKSNVGFVVHYNMPKNLESYYQEAGRAGRDGEPAHCALLFSPGDVQTARFLINNASENEALTEEQREWVRRRELRCLDQMTAYCKTMGCLRAYLLSYFGESAPEECGNCGSCRSQLERRDMTREAQMILSGVARVERKYRRGLGAALVLRMLHGSRGQRVRQLDLDKLPTYGIMKDVSQEQIRDYIDFLVSEGYLALGEGEFPVLRLGPRAAGVLRQGERVTYARRVQKPAEKLRPAREAAPSAGPEGLFQALRGLRAKLAGEEGVPAYMVFSNAALADMAAKQPGSLEEFQQVSGVGTVKTAKYGQAFLKEIAQWLESSSDGGEGQEREK